MTQPAYRADVVKFLKLLFAPENNAINKATSEGQKLLLGFWKPYIERLQGEDPQPTILPRMLPGTDVLGCYALAFTDTQREQLRSDLLAFLGPSYSTFRGFSPPVTSADDCQIAVTELVGNRFYRFRAAEGVRPNQLLDKIERLRLTAWETRRGVEDEGKLSTLQLLYEFEAALSRRDRATAEHYLTHLATQNRVDVPNQLFLRVQMAAALNDWAALLRNDLLTQVLALPRPKVVNEALVISLYRREIIAYEPGLDWQKACTHFREVLLRDYAPVYESLARMDAPEARKSYALFLLQDAAKQDQQAKQRLLASGLKDMDPFAYALAHALAVSVAESPAADSQKVDEQATNRLHEEAILAQQLNDPDLKAKVRDEVEEVGRRQNGPITTDDVTRRLVETWEKDPQVRITSWSQFLMEVGRSNNLAMYEAVIASSWKRWSLDEFAESEQFPTSLKIIEQLTNAAASSPEALDILITFQKALLNDRRFPRMEFRVLYRLCIDAAVYSQTRTLQQLHDLTALLAGYLEQDHNVQKTIGDVGDLIREISEGASDKHLLWVLDTLEVLSSYVDDLGMIPLLPPTAELATKLHNRGRLTPFFRIQVQDLLQRAGARQLLALPTDVAAVGAEETDPLESLRGKTIGIYSLMEKAAKRAADTLRVNYGAIVQVRAEKVASKELANLAKSADFFVVVTQAAAHQATGCIETNKGKNCQILFPRGVGTTSILASLDEALRRSEATALASTG